MSIFSGIIKDLKSFCAKIEAEFKKLFNDAPSWIQIASGFVTYAGPIITTVVTLVGGAAVGAETAAILSSIQSKLATAAAVTTTVDAQTTLPGVLQSIQADLPQLLAALQVENPTLVSKVETYTTLISNEIDALLASIPASTTAAAS